jgi:hypothetical protein
MNRYIMIRRLRGPAFLLLIGVLALMHEAHIIGNFWHLFWPLALILAGVIMLAERAALAAEGGFSQMPYPGVPYQGPMDPSAGTGVPPNSEQPTAIVPAHSHDFEKDPNGGQS